MKLDQRRIERAACFAALLVVGRFGVRRCKSNHVDRDGLTERNFDYTSGATGQEPAARHHDRDRRGPRRTTERPRDRPDRRRALRARERVQQRRRRQALRRLRHVRARALRSQARRRSRAQRVPARDRLARPSTGAWTPSARRAATTPSTRSRASLRAARATCASRPTRQEALTVLARSAPELDAATAQRAVLEAADREADRVIVERRCTGDDEQRIEVRGARMRQPRVRALARATAGARRARHRRGRSRPSRRTRAPSRRAEHRDVDPSRRASA